MKKLAPLCLVALAIIVSGGAYACSAKGQAEWDDLMGPRESITVSTLLQPPSPSCQENEVLIIGADALPVCIKRDLVRPADQDTTR
jgi:hypothetical protein